MISVLVALLRSVTYYVQHRRSYHLPSVHVCLSAIFCPAQTMQHNNLVKMCGPQQTNHFGADGLIGIDVPRPDECNNFQPNSDGGEHLGK